jgi:hypothetical protein
MKKILFTSSMFMFVIVGFSACTKCELCTKDSSPEIRICEDDYNSNTEYGLALDFQEATGYSCK